MNIYNWIMDIRNYAYTIRYGEKDTRILTNAIPSI